MLQMMVTDLTILGVGIKKINVSQQSSPFRPHFFYHLFVVTLQKRVQTCVLVHFIVYLPINKVPVTLLKI